MSRFSSLPAVPPDEPFTVESDFQKDPDPNKCNLGLGVYRSSEGDPWPLPTVSKVEQILLQRDDPSRHEYLGIAGDQVFLEQAQNLLFGFDPASTKERSRVSSVQTVSGTGANHVGAAFLSKHLKPRNIWLSDPTWGNHYTIWESVGMKCREYPYYETSTSSIDFAGMQRVLESESHPGDVLVLHACAHNPTGMDLSKSQWKIVSGICERRQLLAFFDCAYQGFASGDVDDDAWAIRHFFHKTPSLEFCVAQSFSKNFGLYGHRAGSFHLIRSRAANQIQTNCLSHMCQIIRAEFSMAPRAGSDIVKTILGNSDLRQSWEADLAVMTGRLKSMRKALFNELTRLNTPGKWDHIITQVKW